MAIEQNPREESQKEQYEALGRFVASFEDMVDEARIVCMDIVSGLSGSPPYEYLHRILVHIIFHHQLMTAKPVFEIARAMIGEILNNEEFRSKHNIDEGDQAIFIESLTSINSEYTELTKMRNDLLHGTWTIGDPIDDPSEFSIYKPKSNKDGFVGLRDDLPKTAAELFELSKRCENVRHSIEVFYECLPIRAALKIKDCFRHNGKQWECIGPSL